MGFKKSINRNCGVDLTGPSIDAATDVGDVAETMVFQKGSDLHASTAMVTQTGDGPFFVQFRQSVWDGLHGHVNQVQGGGLGTRGLAFPSLTYIEQDGALRLACRPVGELCRGDLFHGNVGSELEAGVLWKTGQTWGIAIPGFCCGPVVFAGAGDQGDAHHGLVAHNSG